MRKWNLARNLCRPRLESLEKRDLTATCVVTRASDLGVGNGQRGDLRYCLTLTNSQSGADEIVFSPNVGETILLHQALPPIADDLAINGPGSKSLTVQRLSTNNFSVFAINPGVNASIAHLSVKNGRSLTGGGIRNEGILTLSDSMVLQSTVLDDGYGGGVFNSGSMTVIRSTIQGNGGGSRASGGGVFNSGILRVIASLVTESWVERNGSGGGFYNALSGDAYFFDSRIADNRGVAIATYGTPSVDGGGARNSGVLVMENSEVVDNQAVCGIFDQGSCTARAGGIFNDGNLFLTQVTLTGNSTSGNYPAVTKSYAGGLFNGGVATIDRSIVAGNSAGSATTQTGSGPGIYTISGSKLNVVNTTIANNYGPAFSLCLGGGIGAVDAEVVVRNSTIVGNFCGGKHSAYGGGISFEGSTGYLVVRNSIIAGNYAEDGGPDFWGTLTTSGFNLIGDPQGGSGFAPTDLLNVDPLLGPLQNNGGPTATFALLPGSPAIDAGDNTDASQWDQRGPGFPRVVNGTIDIGAFEVQATEGFEPPGVWIDPLTAARLIEFDEFGHSTPCESA
jgi:hypothetical protein